jgi:hypothetical protein
VVIVVVPCCRYVDHDLTGLLDERYEFRGDEIKSIMRQLLEVRD